MIFERFSSKKVDSPNVSEDDNNVVNLNGSANSDLGDSDRGYMADDDDLDRENDEEGNSSELDSSDQEESSDNSDSAPTQAININPSSIADVTAYLLRFAENMVEKHKQEIDEYSGKALSSIKLHHKGEEECNVAELTSKISLSAKKLEAVLDFVHNVNSLADVVNKLVSSDSPRSSRSSNPFGSSSSGGLSDLLGAIFGGSTSSVSLSDLLDL